MDEELNEVKLTKLFSNVYDSKVYPEFSTEEINSFNHFVKEKDVKSIVTLFETKANISNDVFKDFIYSKMDSFWEFVVDNSCESLDSEINRSIFLDSLDNYEKLANQFFDFDCQVKNGGLRQWDKNNYSNDIGDLQEFLKNSDYKFKKDFLSLLDGFLDVKDSIDKLDPNDEWYIEDKNIRIDTLKNFDERYFNIRKSWKEYFENYLIDNIPLKYVNKIYELDKNISY